MNCPYTGRKIISPLDFDVKEKEDEKHLKKEKAPHEKCGAFDSDATQGL